MRTRRKAIALRKSQTQQNGNALVWALLFVVISSGMVVSHTIFMTAERREVDVRHRQRALTHTFAQSGLRDATAWFRAQDTQPVELFQPLLDLTATPPVIDTVDPEVGLVREFEISGSLWGRYEVRKDTTFDISLQRGEIQPGRVWDLGSRAYLYRRKDPAKAFDEAPNRVVATTALRSEIRGVPLRIPTDAALIVDDVGDVTLADGSIVDGKNVPAIAYPDTGDIAAVPVGTGEARGTPPLAPVPGLDLSPESVLSMDLDSFRSLADIILEPGGEIPAYIPDNSVVYVDGDLTVTADQRLAGRMLLVINGNLTTTDGSYSALEGLTYVLGNVGVRGRFHLGGTLISPGTVTFGGGGEPVSVGYDNTQLTALKTAVSAYRMSRSVRPDEHQLEPDIDNTADLDPTVTVGPSTEIDYDVTVDEEVDIGADTVIRDTVTIGKNVKIGDRVYIGRGVTIGDETVIESGASIGDGAILGTSVVIHSGAVVLTGKSVPDGTVVAKGDTY